MITKTKKSTFPDQAKLKVMSDRLCDNIENLLEVLDISEYKMSDKMIIMNCPIHGGDNDSAFNLYHTGDTYRGNWKCRTHGCEETFKSSILGFIRGCLSSKKFDWPNKTENICTFRETITFAEHFLGNKLNDIKVNNKDKEKNTFVNAIRYVKENINNANENKISRHSIIKSLDIPSKYFLNRGFSEEILVKYDVGDCINSGKPMSGRAVVPVYDDRRKYMVGCTGRSIANKCDKCNHYHEGNCPNKESLYLHCKWRHNYGFKTQNHLYNYWFAKDHIKQSHSVVLVESPGNVWRLEEAGIHNAVAIFGSSLADIQKMILDTSGAMTIYTIMDNDDAGKKASANIYKKCERTYNIIDVPIDYPDIASMSTDQIEEFIKPRLAYV